MQLDFGIFLHRKRRQRIRVSVTGGTCGLSKDFGALGFGLVHKRPLNSALRNLIASNLLAMASNLRAVASNLRAMASNLRAVASNLRAIASNLRGMASILRAMASNPRAMASNRRAM